MTTNKKAQQTSTSLVPITEDNLNTLTCKQFKVNVSKMIKAELSLNKDMWAYAIAVNNIVVNKYYEEDCKTLQGFAERMGVEKGVITKYTASVNCILNVLGKYGYDMTNLTYSKSYLLSTLKDDVDEFISSYNKDLTKVTMRELEEKVREVKNNKKGVVEVKASNENMEEPTEEEKREELPTFTGRYDDNEVWFTIGKKKYVIPMRDLKHYIKK